MRVENVPSPLVIPTPLLPATRSPIKERNSLGVLPFLIFNDEFQLFVVRVNRQFGTAAVLSWIAEQEIESVRRFAFRWRTKSQRSMT